MYPKAEPTPVTSSAPPASTLYSPPVVRWWQPQLALLASQLVPVPREKMVPLSPVLWHSTAVFSAQAGRAAGIQLPPPYPRCSPCPAEGAAVPSPSSLLLVLTAGGCAWPGPGRMPVGL